VSGGEDAARAKLAHQRFDVIEQLGELRVGGADVLGRGADAAVELIELADECLAMAEIAARGGGGGAAELGEGGKALADTLHRFLDDAGAGARRLSIGGGAARFGDEARDLPGELADGAADLERRLARLPRQRLDLTRDDGKSPARLAGARRLDGGVEREEIGLARDRLDRAGDAGDFGERVADRRQPLLDAGDGIDQRRDAADGAGDRLARILQIGAGGIGVLCAVSVAPSIWRLA